MPVTEHQPTPIQIGDAALRWGARTYVMGIVNVTPDSFSGDGILDPGRAAEQAIRMVAQGADLIDIGAESTRPVHVPIDAEEEWRRLEHPLKAIRRQIDVPISVDTTCASVAERAFDTGADALNDINGLRADPDLAPLIARLGKPAVLMHNQRGRDFGGDVIEDIAAGLRSSVDIATRAGVPEQQLILDPGFGFGWGSVQNLEMLRRLGELRALGRPLLLGTSRKSAIGHVLDRPTQDRLWGTAATMALAIEQGVDIIRVHDIEEMRDVARMTDAIVRGWSEGKPS
jgi:dihydropteroate synthase